MTTNLSGIILYVQNVDLLKLFYVNIFSMQVIEEDPSVWILLRAGSGSLGLHKIGQQYWDESEAGFKFNSNCKLVFDITEDIREARGHLHRYGVVMRPVKTFENHDYWLYDGEDPEGNVFQLRQRK